MLYVIGLSIAAGDGRAGFQDDAPFDAIHVGAAAPVVPQAVSALITSQ